MPSSSLFSAGCVEIFPFQGGNAYLSLSFTVMLMAPLGGRISDRVGVRIPATLGLMLISLAIFSFSFIRPGDSDYSILWRQVLQGIGISLFNPANNSAIIGSLPKERIGLASSFLALARNLGMVVGIAFAEMVIALKTAALSLGPGKAAPSLAGIHDVWRSALLIGLAAIILSWTRGKRSLRQGQEGLSSPWKG